MSTVMEKEEAHRLIDRMPSEATWDDLMREIYVREAIERGLGGQQGRLDQGRKGSPREVWLAGMKVHWTDTAEGHLDAIYAYIALDSPDYAKRVIDRLTRRSQQIADFPFSGRRVPECDADQIREAIEGPYRSFTTLKQTRLTLWR